MIRRSKHILKEMHQRGLLNGIKWIILKISRCIVLRRQVIWFIDLMEIDSEIFALPDNVEIKRLTKEDEIEHDDYIRLVENGTELMGSNAIQLIKKRFNNGAQLWLIKKNGQLAGYRWTIVKDPITPTYLPHTDKDVHSMGVEMLEEFKGHGLYKIFTNFQFIVLKKEGFSRFYNETHVWNKTAVSALSKSHRKIGVAARFSILGKNIVCWYEMS